MAKGTYISENLNENQIALLKFLEDHEILFLKLPELTSQLPENLTNTNELVENLYHKSLLNRKENKNIGIIQEGYGDNIFPLTDIEMTIIDCLDQPRYGGDMADLVKAFVEAKLTNNKLIKYTKAYDNIALIKRLGYLATLFHQDKLRNFINYASTQVNERYSLIDAGGLQQGEFICEWKIRLNISKENLFQMAQIEY